MRKGGESDDLVRFLLDLFRSRFLLQLLFVCVWRIALRSSPPAALSRSCGGTLAHGAWSGNTRSLGYARPRGVGIPWRARDGFAVQSSVDGRVPGVVWRYRVLADTLFGLMGWHRAVSGSSGRPNRRSHHLFLSDKD